MVAESITYPKTFSKRRGHKKLFSVPVGKLRSKAVTTGRNGSSSRRGSRSVSHHKILLKNNRDLARALSHEKERFRGMVTENVNLKAQLHESQLEVHGLVKQLDKSRQSLTGYQNSMMNHIREAVKHSVSLTESLKLAMGLCFTKSKDIPIQMNIVPGCSFPTAVNQPQRQRVNPMVSGHTIRHPTINLKRVVVSTENIIEDMNEASNEQQDMETVDDVSQSLEEPQERQSGLSTCLEEDEDDSSVLNESASEEEENEEDDSIRRKVVLFRNTTFERDKNRPGLEAGESSLPNEMHFHQTAESSCVKECNTQNCEVLNDHKQTLIADKPCMLENFSKRNPVVALNDISRFLQNSNSVNVQKVILDIDNSKLGGRVEGGVLEGSTNEKENYPKSGLMDKSVSKPSCFSSRVDSHLLKGTNELCMEGSIETNDFPDNEKRNIVSNNDAVQANSVPHIEDDPLEGTSWMHLHLFSEKKKRTKKGQPRKFSKEACHKASESKAVEGSSSKVVNASKEHLSDFLMINRPQEENEALTDDVKEPTDEYDVSDFDIGLKNCPGAQSTPMNHGKPSQNGSVSSGSNISKSPSKSTRDSNCSKLFVSPDGSCSQGNSQIKVKEREKNLVVPLIDTKLDAKAFVTVRVKRLNLPDLSCSISHSEVDSNANQVCDEEMEFIGFGANCDAEESLEVLKSIIVNGEELEPRDDYGSCSSAGSVASMWNSSKMHSVSYAEHESCDASEMVEGGRPRRRAAPKELKEPSRRKKLRRK